MGTTMLLICFNPSYIWRIYCGQQVEEGEAILLCSHETSLGKPRPALRSQAKQIHWHIKMSPEEGHQAD